MGGGSNLSSSIHIFVRSCSTDNKQLTMNPDDACPIRDILNRFGDKWSILVMVQLHRHRVLRFSAIGKSIPDISQRMLAVTLRTLEADGLVKRMVYPEVPPRVEYQLTTMGERLIPLIRNMVEWARENRGEIIRSRNAYEGRE